MNRALFALVAILAIQNTYAVPAANVTAGATCGGSTITSTNCQYCDSATSTYCTACKPGYAGPSNVGTTASQPTLCGQACASTSNCFYCAGQQVTPAASVAALATATATALSSLCQSDNTPMTTNVDYASAVCKNTTQTNSTLLYATPSVIQTAATSLTATPPVVLGSYSCFTCMQNCINCRPAGGAPTAQSGVTTCQQCFPGYYLDGNTTTGTGSSAITAGTSCNACTSASTITGTTSNSAYIVVGSCTQCYNKTSCAVGTCTRYAGTTAGAGTADTTSYKYDLANNKCVAVFAGRLSVAIVGVVAVVFATLF